MAGEPISKAESLRFLQKLAMTVVGLTLAVGAIVFSVALIAVGLAAGTAFLGYITLKNKGIIGPSVPPGDHKLIVDADYEVVAEREERERQEKV